MADREQAKRYYGEMLNALAGLEDDLDANSAPSEAKSLLHDVLILCRRDYDARFPEDA